MKPPEPGPALEVALGTALAENRLNPDYREAVRRLLGLPRRDWPMCCGNLCDPCNLALRRAADRTRQLLDAPAP